MFRRYKEKDTTIDAVEKFDEADQERLDGERGASSLESQRRPSPPGSRMFLLVVLVCATALMATFSWKALKVKNKSVEEETENKPSSIQKVIPSYTPRYIKQKKEKQENSDNNQFFSQYNENKLHEENKENQEDLIRQRMLQSPLNSSTGASNNKEAVLIDNNNYENGKNGELAEKLKPMRLSNSVATQLINRDLLITQGTMIDCALNTRLITTQPGMTSCYLTRDIYSASGRVVLLDRLSKVIGFYQGGITQGQARIFVNWSRVETPSGVVINLDSPGTGPLGEGGVGGYVDRHFWERFGGAILISLIGDFGEWVGNQNNGDDHSIQFNTTASGAEQAATEALKNSINIPPTLYKNQGDRISIFVARDLDFSGVYDLTVK